MIIGWMRLAFEGEGMKNSKSKTENIEYEFEGRTKEVDETRRAITIMVE